MKKDKDKKKPVGAVSTNIKPSFTVDRLATYIIGAGVLGLGSYVIWKFVEAGLAGLEKKDEKDKKPDKPNTGEREEVGNETMPTPSSFPIQPDYNNMYYPPYKRDVEILQQALVDIWGRGATLPVNGVDGKYGHETLAAVKKYITPDGVVTKALWESLAKHWAQKTSAMPATEIVANQNNKDATIATDRFGMPIREEVERPAPMPFNFYKPVELIQTQDMLQTPADGGVIKRLLAKYKLTDELRPLNGLNIHTL